MLLKILVCCLTELCTALISFSMMLGVSCRFFCNHCLFKTKQRSPAKHFLVGVFPIISSTNDPYQEERFVNMPTFWYLPTTFFNAPSNPTEPFHHAVMSCRSGFLISNIWNLSWNTTNQNVCPKQDPCNSIRTPYLTTQL